MSWLTHFFFWFTGGRNESGTAYGIWSGFGGANWPILGGGFLLYRNHNCHNARCWRIGKHTTPQGYKLCRRCVGKPRSELTLHSVHEDHA